MHLSQVRWRAASPRRQPGPWRALPASTQYAAAVPGPAGSQTHTSCPARPAHCPLTAPPHAPPPQALTRKFQLAPDVDLQALAQACPPTLTGADLYALCADAWMVALKRRIQQAEAAGQDLSVVRGQGQEEEGEEGGTGAGAERPQVVVSGADLRQALYSLTPSLGPAELEQYRQLKEHYEARGK